MAITYEWKITAMKKAPLLDGLSDVITHVNFQYIGTDEDSEEKGIFQGACPMAAPDADNFTALADLTEANVIAWVQANHPIDHMQEVVNKQIQNKITPTNVDAALPWAPAPDTTTSDD